MLVRADSPTEASLQLIVTGAVGDLGIQFVYEYTGVKMCDELLLRQCQLLQGWRDFPYPEVVGE
jgi:hypothetical protein